VTQLKADRIGAERTAERIAEHLVSGIGEEERAH